VVADVSDGAGTSSGKVCGRSDHDDGQVVDRGDGAWRDARSEQLRRQGIVVEQVAGVKLERPQPAINAASLSPDMGSET